MEKYFAFIKDNIIIGTGQVKCLSDEILNIEITEEIYNDIEHYIWNGTEIVENPNYDTEQLIKAKANKHKENNEKSEIARENQYFTLTIQNKDCTFQTTRRTQQDLMTAKDFIQMTSAPYQWFSDNNEEVYLTLDDVVNISTVFMQKANIYSIWSSYETQIEQATTSEEVNNIVIDYEKGAEE